VVVPEIVGGVFFSFVMFVNVVAGVFSNAIFVSYCLVALLVGSVKEFEAERIIRGNCGKACDEGGWVKEL
jgi:hypothetical protein